MSDTGRSVLSVLGAKGFRVFFLLAGCYAAVVVPAWLLVWTGRLAIRGPLQGVAWHAHEMVHGFTVAVVAGFLLAAVSNWTGRETATGRPLLLLAGVWVAARIMFFLVPGWLGAAVDLAFLPLVAVAIGRPIVAAKDRRNFAFVVLLAALWVANGLVYLDVAGWLPGGAVAANRAAVYLIAVIILVVTGRVVPMFTRNATGVTSIRNLPRVDVVAVAATAGVALAQAWPNAVVVAALAGVAGVATLVRMGRWGTRHTLGNPLLWVLHLGHAAVGIGLCLVALRAIVPTMPVSAPVHAVTVGGIGLLTIGMMSRVSLGHTGRPIRVGSVMAVAFAAVASAALLRVVGPWAWPAHTSETLWMAGIAWAGGFALFTGAYAPILLAPRVDGKPG